MKNIEKYYNLISSKYDSATSRFDWIVPNKIKEVLEKHKLVSDNLNILDLGVGTGQIIEIFKENNSKIFGVDISEEMLALAKQKNPQMEIIKHDLSCGICELFQKDFFDIIISGGVFEFIENIEILIEDIYQILKKDGHFIFTYEILIPENNFQKKRVQENSEGYSDNSETQFKLYRRDEKEITNLILKNKFKIIEHEVIKAFLKTNKRIPVYYGIILVKK